jgi:hypothetical protein
MVTTNRSRVTVLKKTAAIQQESLLFYECPAVFFKYGY